MTSSLRTDNVKQYTDHNGITSYHIYFSGPRGGRYWYFTFDKSIVDKALKYAEKRAKAWFTKCEFNKKEDDDKEISAE